MQYLLNLFDCASLSCSVAVKAVLLPCTKWRMLHAVIQQRSLPAPVKIEDALQAVSVQLRYAVSLR